jgi:hypothetical protein
VLERFAMGALAQRTLELYEKCLTE